MPLREYQRKRDFSKTAEPPAKRKRTGKKPSEGALFVIQKHAASRLHYDFRLEMDGVLKSWAVPRGIPFQKGEKRLAVPVEDHPLDYARFEGVIPAGEYGGGAVMVWDIGTYEVSGGDPPRALREGKLHLRLRGKKLKGEWTLVRTHFEGKDEWLLMKTGEALRPIGARRDDQSALTGRSLKKIAADRDAVWDSRREPAPAEPEKASKRGGKRPKFVAPMKAKLVDALPKGEGGEGWVFELKWDGYRAIALKGERETVFFSRNEKPLKFPELAEAVAALPCKSAVLDGEIVALDAAGRSSFALLQAREMGEQAVLRYYLFDLLALDGADFQARPLSERKARLAELLQNAGEPLRFSADLPGSPAATLAEVKKHGLEGLVAKRSGSRYEPGLRTGSWRKVKVVNEQEFVIGGYTEPRGSRSFFGALLLGYFEGKTLRFAGKVGAGFNEKWLAALHRQFQPIREEACPFADLPSRSAGRWNQGLTLAEMKKCTWLRPELVCQIRFSQWTRDGKLRHAVFLGMRHYRPAAEVVRESV